MPPISQKLNFKFFSKQFLDNAIIFFSGTPPDWSEMERIVGRPSRLSETELSIDFKNRYVLVKSI